MPENTLMRTFSLPAAVMMGMGSIIGTGVFVSLGLAAGLTGENMLGALFFAGCLAVCNGLSTAQLAASHPKSGGTYEYAYKLLHPWLGYFAAWLFICAKSASAATAAIGFGAYLSKMVLLQNIEPWHLGLLAVSGMIIITLFGIRRSNFANVTIVSITLLSLSLYVLVIGQSIEIGALASLFANVTDASRFNGSAFFEAAALLFVAYTGYGRIATLGEEVTDPEKNIPKAIVMTLTVSFALYMAVALVSLLAVGPQAYWQETVTGAAPLQSISQGMGHPIIASILAVGAMTAMLGVLLNLILGLSRIVFAMGRKRDLPPIFAFVDSKHHAPTVAILAVGLIIMALVMLKNIKLTWSFSAFTVLVYYAITNAAALRLPKEKRLYPRVFAWLGLIGCLTLSFWVEKEALLLGLSILLVGCVWRFLYRLITADRAETRK